MLQCPSQCTALWGLRVPTATIMNTWQSFANKLAANKLFIHCHVARDFEASIWTMAESLVFHSFRHAQVLWHCAYIALGKNETIECIHWGRFNYRSYHHWRCNNRYCLCSSKARTEYTLMVKMALLIVKSTADTTVASGDAIIGDAHAYLNARVLPICRVKTTTADSHYNEHWKSESSVIMN